MSSSQQRKAKSSSPIKVIGIGQNWEDKHFDEFKLWKTVVPLRKENTKIGRNEKANFACFWVLPRYSIEFLKSDHPPSVSR
jgi:hypothetical protein